MYGVFRGAETIAKTRWNGSTSLGPLSHAVSVTLEQEVEMVKGIGHSHTALRRSAESLIFRIERKMDCTNFL